MKTSNATLKWALLLGLGAALLTVNSAKAQTVTLVTGGDAGEGYSPLSMSNSADFAYDFAGATTTIQGITFTNTPSNVTIGRTGDYGGTGPSQHVDFGASTNDVNLATALSTDLLDYSGNGSIVMTITGLTSGVTYQLDSLLSNSATFGDQTIPVIVTDSAGTIGSSSFYNDTNLTYDVSDTFVSNGSNVTVTYATANGGAEYFTAASLTSLATPEPSTYLLLGLGGIALFLVRGRFNRSRI